jgi:hypothetical protein
MPTLSGSTNITSIKLKEIATPATPAAGYCQLFASLSATVCFVDPAGTVTTLCPAVGASTIVTVGTLTAGATGAGFTIALTTSTVTGTLADARLSSNVALLNAANRFSATGAHGLNTTDNGSAVAQTIWRLENDANGAGGNLFSPALDFATAAANVNARVYAKRGGGYGGTLYFQTAESVAGNLADVMSLSPAGVLTVSGLASGVLTSASGVITSSSDERLKDILGPLSYGLKEVLGLRPIRARWNTLAHELQGLPTDVEFGTFGAIQIEPFMPLAVSMGPDGYRGLNDRVILGAVVNATQELAARVSALEARS